MTTETRNEGELATPPTPPRSINALLAEANAGRDYFATINAELDDAEAKAWDALSRYKFQMFGYWCGVWVHLNRIQTVVTGKPRANPWTALVKAARDRTGGYETCDRCGWSWERSRPRHELMWAGHHPDCPVIAQEPRE